ncbi:hypothetical protein GVAV_000683 [Gurleya vavrai]
MAVIRLPDHHFHSKSNIKGIIHSLIQSLNNQNNSDDFQEILNKINCILKTCLFYLNTKSSIQTLKHFEIINIETADFLAFNYESIRNNFIVESDIETAAKLFLKEKNNLKSKIFIPSIINNLFENENIKNSENIERLMEIFLIKEDISFFEYKIEDFILILNSKNFTVKAVLCAEIENPVWKIIEVKTNFYANLEILLSYSLLEIKNFVMLYEANLESKNIYNKLKNLNFNQALKGNFGSFVCCCNNTNLHGKIINNKFRMIFENMSINSLENYAEKLFENIIKQIIKKCFNDTRINNFCIKCICLHKKICKCHNFEILIDDLIYEIISNMNFDLESGLTYKNKNITIEEIGNEFFRKKDETKFDFEIFNAKKIIDYKNINFGIKNIYLERKIFFICIKIEKLIEEKIFFKLFIGKNQNSLLSYNEIYYLNQIFSKNKIQTCIEEFEFLKKTIVQFSDFLFILYELGKYNFKIDKYLYINIPHKKYVIYFKIDKKESFIVHIKISDVKIKKVFNELVFNLNNIFTFDKLLDFCILILECKENFILKKNQNDQ